MKRRWKILIAVAVGLLVVSVVWLATIHFQPKNELEAYKDLLRAKGEKLKLAEVLPQPVPPEKNATEIIREAFALVDAGMGIGYTNLPTAMHMISPGKAMIEWAQPVARCASYQTSNTWEEIGLAVEEDRAGLALLETLTNQAVIDFQLDYSKGFEVLLPHLASLKRSAQKLSAAAIFNLHKGDTASAITNVCVMLALAQENHDERFLISQLVRMALAQIAFSVNWELLQATNLTDNQLATLQKHWGELEFIEAAENSFLMERAIGITTIEKIRDSNTEFNRWLDMPGTGTGSGGSSSGSVGWFDGIGDWVKDGWQNTKFSAGKFMWRVSWSYADELHKLQTDQVILETVRLIETNQFFQPSFSNMMNRLASMPHPTSEWTRRLDFDQLREMISDSAGWLGNSVRKVMAAEISKRVTITAIALKRYRLKHGNYPEGLPELTPEFLTAMPLDPVDGKPLRYRRNADGTFLLYSVGEDSVDNGGNATQTSPTSKTFYWQRGFDWVWPQPATAAEVQYYFEHPPK